MNKTLRSTVILINGGISQIQVTGNRSYYLKIGTSFIIALVILLGWLVWFVSIQPIEIWREVVGAVGFSSKIFIIAFKVVNFLIVSWLRGG